MTNLKHNPQNLRRNYSPARIQLRNDVTVFVADHDMNDGYTWMRTFSGQNGKIPNVHIVSVWSLETEYYTPNGEPETIRKQRVTDERVVDDIRNSDGVVDI